MNSQDRITELTNCINQLDKSYYIDNENLVSDAVYDITFQELVSLETLHPEFKLSNSPTNRVSGGVSKEFSTAKHSAPMLSIRTETEPSLEVFEQWKQSIIKQLQPLEHPVEFVAEYKYDGLGLSLVYENGVLIQALTRGDGEMGEVVTENAKVIHSVPIILDTADNTVNRLVIRGEVMMTHKVFEKLNLEKVSRGEAPFANTRNAASGSLRLLDSSVTAKRHLVFIPYQIVELVYNNTKMVIDGQWQAYRFMEIFGFTVMQPNATVEQLLSTVGVSELAVAKRKDIHFDIDGFVVKVQRTSHQEKLGSRSREPNWAVAYKFQAEVAQTKLTAIDIQIGRTGKVTPVARLNPVQVGGTVVSNVTLHNVFDLRARKVRIGDDVFIRRAGDVIPEISGYNPLSRLKYLPNFKVPTTCPSCGGKVERLKGEREYYCMNSMECRAQLKQSITHYASREAMNIQGLGDKMVEKLISLGFITKPLDIYCLSALSFHGLQGFGEKTVINLLASIEASRTTTFAKFLFAVGIRNVGEGTAKALSQVYAGPMALAFETVESLVKIDDIGKITAESIHSFFANVNNRTQVFDIWLQYLKVQAPVNTSSDLAGQSFVVTGTFGETTRDDLKKFIEKNGGVFQKSVGKKTDYLVVGEGGGSKRGEAKKLNIPIISMAELYKLGSEIV